MMCVLEFVSAQDAAPQARTSGPPLLQVWWHTTVLVAAITAFLQPYYIAFAPPGL